MKKVLGLVAFLLLAAPVLVSAATCPNITLRLSSGTSHSQVIALKKFLVAEGVMAPTSNTTFFGPLTQAALQKWQCKKGIVCSGTPASTGYGATGPLTRAALKNCSAFSGNNPAGVTKPIGIPPVQTPPLGGTGVGGSGGSAVSPSPVTYFWSTGAWSACVNNSQARTVTCLSSQNQNVADSLCGTSKPAASQSCSSSAPTPLTCTFPSTGSGQAAQTIAHGASVTAYQSATVAYGNQCVSETRTCSNGTLSGSYTNASCSVGGGASCTFSGQTVVHGASVTAYQSSSVSVGQQCVSESRSCSNGTLSGSYANASCSVQAFSTAVQPPGLPTRTLSLAENGNGMQDFLISDVCVDGQDQPIPGDPATCTTHRDLKFGEYIPYVRTDKQSGVAQQASISFPVQALDGTLLAIKSFDFGAAMGGAAFRDYDVGSASLYKYDGYDLREANGAWTSIIASRDYDGWKRMWGPGCTHNDTWLYFPTNAQKGQSGNFNNDLNFTVDNPTCPGVYGTAMTNWTWYSTPVTYTSGKSLDSIVTWHFNSPDPAQITNFEQFYNTRTYGGTRWEAWSTTGLEDTSGSCNGLSHAEFYGKMMYRTACRDWTYTQSVDVSISPLASTMGDDLVFSQNLLSRGDFAQGSAPAWKTYEASGASVPLTLKKNTDNNSYVEVACATNNCSSAILYQDVSSLALYRGATELRVGGTIKTSAPATSHVTVYLVRADGTFYGQKDFTVPSDSTWRNFGGLYTVNLSSDVAWIRFQIALNSGVTYSLDDMYLTPAK